jgi:hypothetical protein
MKCGYNTKDRIAIGKNDRKKFLRSFDNTEQATLQGQIGLEEERKEEKIKLDGEGMVNIVVNSC